MTTYFNFAPTQAGPFQFQPTLDGDQYTAIVRWNLFAQRYYIDLYTLGNQLVATLPVIGSSPIVFTESASWAFGRVKVVTSTPHNFERGALVPVDISGLTPAVYNGTDIEALILDDLTLTYALQSDPGIPSSTIGVVGRDTNIVGGYFDSTLVYRPQNKQFEVNP